jgi:hypothetical protein
MIKHSTAGAGAVLLASLLGVVACGGSGSTAAGAPSQAGVPVAASSSGQAAGTGGGGSGGSGGASSGADNAACALVTKAEVAATVAYDVTSAGGAGSTTGAICVFQGADAAKAQFNVATFNGTANMGLMLQLEPTTQHVDGLGTDAFWAQGAGILFVRNGEHAFAFTDVDLGSSATPPDALVQLAKTALSRLG